MAVFFTAKKKQVYYVAFAWGWKSIPLITRTEKIHWYIDKDSLKLPSAETNIAAGPWNGFLLLPGGPYFQGRCHVSFRQGYQWTHLKIDLAPKRKGKRSSKQINFRRVGMLVLGRVTSILGEGSFWRKAMWICWSCNDSQMMVKLVFEHRLSAIWQFCYVRYVCLRWILVLYTRRVKVQELGCLPSTSMCVKSSMERSHILSLFLFCLAYIAFWFCQLTPLPINRTRVDLFRIDLPCIHKIP